jgi:hypothetical protein
MFSLRVGDVRAKGWWAYPARLSLPEIRRVSERPCEDVEMGEN